MREPRLCLLARLVDLGRHWLERTADAVLRQICDTDAIRLYDFRICIAQAQPYTFIVKRSDLYPLVVDVAPGGQVDDDVVAWQGVHDEPGSFSHRFGHDLDFVTIDVVDDAPAVTIDVSV